MFLRVVLKLLKMHSRCSSTYHVLPLANNVEYIDCGVAR